MTTHYPNPVPESYTSAGLAWSLIERIGNWAIYGGRLGSIELVRTNVRSFPPCSESWGKDGFSFNGTGAIERARIEARKRLNTKGRVFCKTRHDEDMAPGAPAEPSATRNAVV